MMLRVGVCVYVCAVFTSSSLPPHTGLATSGLQQFPFHRFSRLPILRVLRKGRAGSWGDLTLTVAVVFQI